MICDFYYYYTSKKTAGGLTKEEYDFTRRPYYKVLVTLLQSNRNGITITL